MRRLIRIASCLVLGAALAVPPSAAQAQAPSSPPPSSMAAIGDSISQAFDVCCWYGNHPANSWSTGGTRWDGVTSHYERIRARNPDIAGRNHNNSVSGARMSDAPAQAQRAVDQRVQYVTILMGANDVCTSSPGTMTPVSTFRAQFRETLETLDSGLPGRARVFVSSIPDVYRLWQIYHTDRTAQFVWDIANLCKSLLSTDRTEEQRQQVRQRTIAFNQALAEVCAQHAFCRFDDNATFAYSFARGDVSRLDYFHPSLRGQAGLARISWSRSWWDS